MLCALTDWSPVSDSVSIGGLYIPDRMGTLRYPHRRMEKEARIEGKVSMIVRG